MISETHEKPDRGVPACSHSLIIVCVCKNLISKFFENLVDIVSGKVILLNDPAHGIDKHVKVRSVRVSPYLLPKYFPIFLHSLKI